MALEATTAEGRCGGCGAKTGTAEGCAFCGAILLPKGWEPRVAKGILLRAMLGEVDALQMEGAVAEAPLLALRARIEGRLGAGAPPNGAQSQGIEGDAGPMASGEVGAIAATVAPAPQGTEMPTLKGGRPQAAAWSPLPEAPIAPPRPLRFTLPPAPEAAPQGGAGEAAPGLGGEEIGYLVGGLLTLVGSFYLVGIQWSASAALLQGAFALAFLFGYSGLFLFLGRRLEGIRGMALGARVLGGISLALWPVIALPLARMADASLGVWAVALGCSAALGAQLLPRAFALVGARGGHRSVLALSLIGGLWGPLSQVGGGALVPWLGLPVLAWGVRGFIIARGFERPGFGLGLLALGYAYALLLGESLLGGGGQSLYALLPALAALALYGDVALGRWRGVHRLYIDRTLGVAALAAALGAAVGFGALGLLGGVGWWVCSGLVGSGVLLLGALLYRQRSLGRLGLAGLSLGGVGILSVLSPWLGPILGALSHRLGGRGGWGMWLLPVLLIPFGLYALGRGLAHLRAMDLREDALHAAGIGLAALALIPLGAPDAHGLLCALALPALALSAALYGGLKRPFTVWLMAAWGALGILGALGLLGLPPAGLAAGCALLGLGLVALGGRIWPARPFPILGRHLAYAGMAAWALGVLALWGTGFAFGILPGQLLLLLGAGASTFILVDRPPLPAAQMRALGAGLTLAALALAQARLTLGLTGVEGALALTLGLALLYGVGARRDWRFIHGLGHLVVIPAALAWPLLFRAILAPFAAMASESLGYGGARLPLAFYSLTLAPLIGLALVQARALRRFDRPTLAADTLQWGGILAGILALVSLSQPGELRPALLSLVLAAALYGALAWRGAHRAYFALAAVAALGWVLALVSFVGLPWVGRGAALAVVAALMGAWTRRDHARMLPLEVALIGEGALLLGAALSLEGLLRGDDGALWGAASMLALAGALGHGALSRGDDVRGPLFGALSYGAAVLGLGCLGRSLGWSDLPGGLALLGGVSLWLAHRRGGRLGPFEASVALGGVALTLAGVWVAWVGRLQHFDLLRLDGIWPEGPLLIGALLLARWGRGRGPLRWMTGLMVALELHLLAATLGDALGLGAAWLPMGLALGGGLTLLRGPRLAPFWASLGRWVLSLGPMVSLLGMGAALFDGGALERALVGLVALALGALGGWVSGRRRHLFVGLGGLALWMAILPEGPGLAVFTGAAALGLALCAGALGLAQGAPLNWMAGKLGLGEAQPAGAPGRRALYVPLWVWAGALAPLALGLGILGRPGLGGALACLLGGLALIRLLPPAATPLLLGGMAALVSLGAQTGGALPILLLAAGGAGLSLRQRPKEAIGLGALAVLALLPWGIPLGARGALATPLIPAVLGALAFTLLWGARRDPAREPIVAGVILGDLALISAIAWVGVLLDTGRPTAAILPALSLAMGAVSLGFSRAGRGIFEGLSLSLARGHILPAASFALLGAVALTGPKAVDHGMILAALGLLTLGALRRGMGLRFPSEIGLGMGLIGAAYAYVRLATPLGSGLIGLDGPLAVPGAFALMILWRQALARGLDHIAEPARAASLILPALGFGLSIAQGHVGGGLWGALGTVYLAHYLLAPRQGLMVAALALYNLGLGALWIRIGVSNLQLFALPLGLSLAFLAHLYRRTLSRQGLETLRNSAAGLILASSVIESIVSPWNSLALIVLSLALLFGGALFKARSFLRMGGIGVVLALVMNLARFGLAFRQFWALHLTALGLLLLAAVALYSWRRDEIEGHLVRLRARIAAWE